MASDGSQDSIDHPGLTADFRGEPAGNDGDEGQRETQESRPKQRAIVCQAMPVAQIAAEPGEPQHQQTTSDHDPEAKNGITTGGQFSGGMLLRPVSPAVRLSESIRLPNGGGSVIANRLRRFSHIGPGEQHFRTRFLIVPAALDRSHLGRLVRIDIDAI